MTSAAELSTGEKLSTALSKKSGTKRENPPCTPYKRKARGKEAKRDYLRNPVQSRAGAYARVKEPPRTCTTEVAGLVAASIARDILHCSLEKNLRLWAAFCLHNDINEITQLAYEYQSYGSQGEVDDRVRAFQAMLNEKYPATVAYLVARKRARQGGAQ